jgi:hypothetical protein
VSSLQNEANQYAVLGIPAADGRSEKQEITCLFESLQANKLLVETQGRPALSAAVSIEYNDVLFLGEVVRVAPGSHGTWRVEVKVEQALNGLQSLVNLRARLLGYGAVSAPRREQTAFSLCA